MQNCISSATVYLIICTFCVAAADAVCAAAAGKQAKWSTKQLKGLSQLRQVINMVNAHISFPATMVCMQLLRLGDSNISHEPVSHNFAAFTQAVAARAGLDAPEEEAAVSVQVRRTGSRVAASSCLTDYDHRPAELEEYSPVLLTMLYKVRKYGTSQSTGDQEPTQEAGSSGRPAGVPREGTYLLLAPSHPYYSSHVMQRNRRPVPFRY